MKTDILTIEDVLSVWQNKGIVRAAMEFDCGGDSMGNTHMRYYDEKDKEIEAWDLDDYFTDEVYRHIQFYENSDGYYHGEAGFVYVDYDEETKEFNFKKVSQSEYHETISKTFHYKLTKQEDVFLSTYVRNINGSNSDHAISYKTDFIMTDEHEVLVENLINKIVSFAEEAEINADGLEQEDFSWTTLVNEKPLTIENSNLHVEVNKTFLEYRDN